MAALPSTITVKVDTKEATEQIRAVSMALSNIHLFTDLPVVTVDGGCYVANDYSRYISTVPEELDKDIRTLVAIKLRMEADAKKSILDIEYERVQAAADKRAKQAHDDLRTSPIALKALAYYNSLGGKTSYASWDECEKGQGQSDETVSYWIAETEKKAAEEAEKKALLQEALDKANWERGVARSAKEAAEKLGARRDALAQAFWSWSYAEIRHESRKAVDMIIDLEDAK